MSQPPAVNAATFNPSFKVEAIVADFPGARHIAVDMSVLGVDVRVVRTEDMVLVLPR